MFSRLNSRLLALGAAFALALGVVACSDDVDPIAPGLGFAEADTITGTLGTDSSSSSAGFVANRSGDVTAVVCGPSNANFDAWAITNSRTVSGARVADTLASGTATTGCETLRFRTTAGQTYRLAVRSVTGRGSYVACFAYETAPCAGLQPTVPAIPGIPLGYYLNAEGKTGDDLIAALHAIVRTGHNGFTYDSARGFLYQDVEDPDDDNLIEEVYAGRISTVDRRANTATDAGDANLNAEHAWPQSCGARLDRSINSTVRSTGPRGDLHILFAADANANNSRSNFPFGMVTGTPSATFGPDSAGNFSRRGSNGTITVFEPRAEKRGDLARALFYFFVRYVPEIPGSISLENFNLEEATLRQWATQDPVDAFERARNDEIYAVQGNRNPFVDVPEFLTRITDFPNTATGAHATCDF
jgi:hypothetical protein